MAAVIIILLLLSRIIGSSEFHPEAKEQRGAKLSQYW